MIQHNHYVQHPTKIINTILDIPKKYKQRCIEEAYKIGDKQNNRTNVKAIMSSYFIWNETQVFNLLIDNILKKINLALPASSFSPNFTYSLEASWFAIYKSDHYTVPHHHLPADISFIYYLKANDSSSPLVFDQANFVIKPHDNLLVIFPSYLTHEVPIHKGEDRICLAGNLNLKR
jgi:hypothetical protein